MSVTLLERVAASPSGVDESAGVLRGCRVCGLTSANGREYLPEALKGAVPMYEGARVYLDHPDNPHKPRSIRDVIGHLRNVRPDAGGLRGDVHLNQSHPETPQILWAAKHAPRTLGLSHNAVGSTTEGRGGRTVVNKITRVHSVDLVAEPATATSLFEGKTMTTAPDLGPTATVNLIVQQTHSNSADMARRVKLVNQAKALMSEALDGLDLGAGDTADADDDADAAVGQQAVEESQRERIRESLGLQPAAADPSKFEAALRRWRQ